MPFDSDPVYCSCALDVTGAHCWGADWYGQTDVPAGLSFVLDAFPLNPAEWTDTDGDGIGNNADLDDDNDGVPDYIDADPLNAANTNERILPLDAQYSGAIVRESISQ